MRYVAVLKGDHDVIRDIASCFVGTTLGITQLGQDWILESPAFNNCGRPQEVFPIADALLVQIHQVLSLYCHLYRPLSVLYIQAFDSDGRPSKRGIRGSVEINVWLSKGLAQLSHTKFGQSVGVHILERAAGDQALTEALSLWGKKEVSWGQIYDVIEFCGGADEIAHLGWASKERTREIRQTANHYRHLGNPKKYPLPTNLISLPVACSFAADLLKKWISARLTPG
jgi:hypothetical protein